MAVMQEPVGIFTFTGNNLSQGAHAAAEKFGWLPKEQEPRRWLRPIVVAWHRFRKLLAGAYYKRQVAIEIYTKKDPTERSCLSGRVGFRWPQ